jgi:hypothetical protein
VAGHAADVQMVAETDRDLDQLDQRLAAADHEQS